MGVWVVVCVRRWHACLERASKRAKAPSSEITESSEKKRAGWERKGKKGRNESERTLSSSTVVPGQQHD